MPGRGKQWKVGGLPDSTVTSADIKNFEIIGSDLSLFVSTEITGTGALQNILHGLGRTPTVVW